MSRADRAIRALAAVTVVALAVIAAVVSYQHAYAIASEHGQDGWTARLTPLTIDGLVFVPGLVMLDAARRGSRAPFLAWLALGLGIGATGAVNVLHGLDHGPVGAAVAGWPAVALVLAHELLMGMIRRGGVSSHTVGREESREWAEVWRSVSRVVAEGAKGTRIVGTPAAAVRLTGANREVLAGPGEGEGVHSVDAPGSTRSITVPADHALSHPAVIGPPGQPLVADLDSAIVSARSAGRSIRAIAEEFGVTRYRVRKALAAG
ncbi:DUF2637 domain-containing protein [Actinocorallia sp. API 0066]|uniref:DUF2637 domain-containing protein n=1 Tax=Actinocorallia sp. API 0066 TaxID=2896846 RepID=UPI001E293FC8|nr:DUF2637 domain-containing protein [Actinocorallia sp. API 0066]MCD0450753.1 DUF2637 domain-containing protein [Actinocorallia sp. API 0066]